MKYIIRSPYLLIHVLHFRMIWLIRFVDQPSWSCQGTCQMLQGYGNGSPFECLIGEDLQVNGSWYHRITHQTDSKSWKPTVWTTKVTKVLSLAWSSWNMSLYIPPFMSPQMILFRLRSLHVKHRPIDPKWSNSPASCCSSSVIRSGWSVPCINLCSISSVMRNWFHDDETTKSPQKVILWI